MTRRPHRAARLPTSIGILALCLLSAACSQTAPRQPVLSASEHAELTALAAGPNAPEGLSEALAAADATEKWRACQDKVAGVARDMKVMGAVGDAVGVAGGLAGSGGKAATKMVGVLQAKAIRARLSQLSPC